MDYCKFHIIMQLFSKIYFISRVGVKNDLFDLEKKWEKAKFSNQPSNAKMRHNFANFPTVCQRQKK